MALLLKFSTSKTSDCKEFIFTQTTGLYDLTTNPTGWNTPNSPLSGVLDSYVIIKDLTSNVQYTKIEVDASDASVDNFIYYDLIKQGETLPIKIDNIQDGIYSFTHTVLGDKNILYSTTNYFMSLCKIECQLKQLSIKYINYSNTCSPCENKLLNLFVEAMSLYDILNFTFKCGQFTDFNKILNNLQSLLKQLDCKKC